MPRELDKRPGSPTLGMLIDVGAPTPKAPYINAPAPLEKVTDRPIEPLKDVAARGGAIMIDDKIYTGGLGLNTYSNNNISQGSEAVRDKTNTMVDGANNLSTNLSSDIATTTIDDLKKMLGMGEIDYAAREREVEAAGAREAEKWKPIISEAQTQKEKGFAKATISVGERGGFMSSQMAGAAALVPTVGADFSGAGGKLNEIESDYDNNISSLKAKSLEAISLAKEQARAAQEQRDSNAYQKAIELFKLSQSANAQAVALAQDKVNLVSSYKKLEQSRVDYSLDKLEKIAAVGGAVPDEMKAEADALYGEGWSDLYIQAKEEAAAADNEAAQISSMNKIVDLLKSYPAGKLLTIGDNTYETIGSSADTQIFKEEDRGGNITFLTVDKRTGEVIGTASGGKVGKGSAPAGNNNSTSSKEKYFTRPVDGKVQYFYGDPNNLESAQKLTSSEFYKGNSVSEKALLGEDEPQYMNYNDTVAAMEEYKASGLSESAAEKKYAEDYEVYDSDAQLANEAVYQGVNFKDFMGGIANAPSQISSWMNTK